MTNAEARFNKSLRPRKPEGSLGRTAQDVHLDSHTAPELCMVLHEWLAVYSAVLNIHRNGVLRALAWLVPHETPAVSAVLSAGILLFVFADNRVLFEVSRWAESFSGEGCFAVHVCAPWTIPTVANLVEWLLGSVRAAFAAVFPWWICQSTQHRFAFSCLDANTKATFKKVAFLRNILPKTKNKQTKNELLCASGGIK